MAKKETLAYFFSLLGRDLGGSRGREDTNERGGRKKASDSQP